MVQQHGAAGDVLECRAAEPEAGGGADGLGHRGSLFSKDIRSRRAAVETKIKNVSVEDTALRPKILQFSGKNAPEWRKNRTKMLDKGRAG